MNVRILWRWILSQSWVVGAFWKQEWGIIYIYFISAFLFVLSECVVGWRPSCLCWVSAWLDEGLPVSAEWAHGWMKVFRFVLSECMVGWRPSCLCWECMVGWRPSCLMSASCVVPLRRDWANFYHTGWGRVGRVWSAREKSLEILSWLGIKSGPQRQTVRYIYSPTELPWLKSFYVGIKIQT